MLIKWPKKSKVLTHRLFRPVHTRLPDQGVIAELHLVGVNHVPTMCEWDTSRLIRHQFLGWQTSCTYKDAALLHASSDAEANIARIYFFE